MGAAESSNAVMENGHRFSCQFYKQLVIRKPDGNVFFSPLGIASSLALVAAACKRKSRDQLLETLGQKTSSKLDSAFKELLESLVYNERNANTVIENAVFLSPKCKRDESYVKRAKKYYHAIVMSANFSHHREALEQVNGWLNRVSGTRMTELFEPFHHSTRLVFANFVYHKTLWASKFDPRQTHAGTFEVDDDQTVTVQYMRQTRRYRTCYNKALDCIMVVLPYSDQKTAMLLMIPNKFHGLANLEAALSPKFIRDTFASLTEKREITIKLPTFSVHETYSLGPALDAMGASEIFNPKTADLHNLCSGCTDHGDLAVDMISHKGILKVNEEGLEPTTFSDRTKINIPTVKAGRPFIMMIYDKNTKTIFFMGRVKNPHPH